MKPFSVVTVPGYASRPLKPIEMALLAAMLLENGMAAHAPFAVTRLAKCCLASWMGRAFFTHERRGFTDRLILNTAWGLAREGRLLVSQDQDQRIALTADGRPGHVLSPAPGLHGPGAADQADRQSPRGRLHQCV